MQVRRSALIGTILLAVPLLTATPAAAAPAAAINTTVPTLIRSGDANDLTVDVDNTGGPDHNFTKLRLTVTPAKGSPTRPLAAVLRLDYLFGSRPRTMSLETVGDTLVATTPDALDVPAGAVRSFRFSIVDSPGLAPGPHVDAADVLVTAAAVDVGGEVYATDPTPSRLTLAEPRTTLDNWPDVVTVGTPFVVSTTFTNTTPAAYVATTPYLNLYSPESGAVQVEVRDGTGWRVLSQPSDSQHWLYEQFSGSVTLAPGKTYRNSLRITYRQDVDGAGQSVVQHLILGTSAWAAATQKVYTVVAGGSTGGPVS